jgi:hypothetical protein
MLRRDIGRALTSTEKNSDDHIFIDWMWLPVVYKQVLRLQAVICQRNDMNGDAGLIPALHLFHSLSANIERAEFVILGFNPTRLYCAC